MARKAYARRYAQAVFEIALEKKELERWQSDLQKIMVVVGDSSFMAMLGSPKFRFDDKARLLAEHLENVNPLALNLIYLLVNRGKLEIIGDITDEFQHLLDSHHGIEQAEIITAVPLSDEDKEKLAGSLGALVSKKVAIKAKVDPDVIGGITARIDGKLLDGSTRNRLAALKKNLVGA